MLCLVLMHVMSGSPLPPLYVFFLDRPHSSQTNLGHGNENVIDLTVGLSDDEVPVKPKRCGYTRLWLCVSIPSLCVTGKMCVPICVFVGGRTEWVAGRTRVSGCGSSCGVGAMGRRVCARLRVCLTFGCPCFRVKLENDTQQYFQGDCELPVYSRVTAPYRCNRLINILLDECVDKPRVCGVQPLGVMENATFLIDLDRVRFDDLKADDVGSWKPTGTKHTYFCFDDDGETMYCQGIPHGGGYYNLTRRYYVHATCQTFRRLIVSVEGSFVFVVFRLNRSLMLIVKCA